MKKDLGSMVMSYAAGEEALRFSGHGQSFWYPGHFGGVYDGTVCASVKFETLGTTDYNGNGLGGFVGLRVDPDATWGRWGVWGGLVTIRGVQYAAIRDGAAGDLGSFVEIPYPYAAGRNYHLRLTVIGSSAELWIDGVKVLSTNSITQPSSGIGTTAVWLADGASGSEPSSFLVDDWMESASSPFFSDSFGSDTSVNYEKKDLGSMTMAYASGEQALRFSGHEQAFWYPRYSSVVYDGTVCASVRFETLGTADINGNGLGACIGLRVDPDGAWAHWGVWGGLFTFGGTQYAVIGDGAPAEDSVVRVAYPYSAGRFYHLRLAVVGSSAELWIDGSKVLTRDSIAQPSSGRGTTGIWVADGASGSEPSSFLVDDWTVTEGVLLSQVATPVLDPAPGACGPTVLVTATCATPLARMYYILDGSEPTEVSCAYAGPITIDAPKILKVKAFAAPWRPSDSAGGLYATAAPHDLNGDWAIDDAELASARAAWLAGSLDEASFLDLADFQARGSYHWDEAVGRYVKGPEGAPGPTEPNYGARIAWSSYLGGNDGDRAWSVVTDEGGNVYITGGTYSHDFSATPGAAYPAFESTSSEAFVMKVTAAGEVEWATFLGGSYWNSGRAIAVGASGDLYVVGETESPDFPVKGAFQTAYGGNGDVFVLRLSSAGEIRWSTFFGGSGAEDATFDRLVLDPSGNLLVVGHTDSTDVPVLNAAQPTSGGGQDLFLIKVSPEGELLWSTYLGGSGTEDIQDSTPIGIDSSGNLLFVASTTSPDLATVNAFQSACAGDVDMMLGKISADGQVAWLSYLGGSGIEQVLYPGWMAVDAQDGLIAGFSTTSRDMPVPGGCARAFAGDVGNYAARIGPSGDLVWGTYIGSNTAVSQIGWVTVAADPAGNAYVACTTDVFDFPVTGPNTAPGSANSVILAKVTPTGALLWATYVGGSLCDEVVRLALDPYANPVVMGFTCSHDLGTPNGFDAVYGGHGDRFAARVSKDGQTLWAGYIGGEGREQIRDFAFTHYGDLVVVGETSMGGFATDNGFDTTFGGPGSVSLIEETWRRYCDAYVMKITSSAANVLRMTPTHVLPGEQVTVALSVDVADEGLPAAVVIREAVPAGWTASDVSPSCTHVDLATGTMTWLLTGSDVADRVITYTLTAPGDAVMGSAARFSGDASYNDFRGDVMVYATPSRNSLTVGAVVAAPVLSPAPGCYGASVTVAITCETAGAEIRYTTDGTEPTGDSALYVGPFVIGTPTVIRAKTYKTEWTPSDTVGGLYETASPYDQNGDWRIDDAELSDFRAQWEAFGIESALMLSLADFNAAGAYHWDETRHRYTPGPAGAGEPSPAPGPQAEAIRAVLGHYAPGGTIGIQIDCQVDERAQPSAVIVEECIPAGWAVASSSPACSRMSADGRRVSWLFCGPEVTDSGMDATYTLTAAASSAGTESVSGRIFHNDPFGNLVEAAVAGSAVIYEQVAVITTELSGGTVGSAYSQAVTAVGGIAPYSWSVIEGNLPPGLELSAGGAISGIPTTYGMWVFTVRADDSLADGNFGTTPLTLVIDPLPLLITTSALADGLTGVQYSQTIEAAGGAPPYSWSASGSLPAGLSVDSGSGVISGTPQAAGAFGFTVSVTDSLGTTTSRDLSIAVAAPRLRITSPNGGESWGWGVSRTITWTSTLGGNVRIELYRGGDLVSTIVSSTANDGSYPWSVPAALPAGTDYRMKITWTSDPSTYDFSDAGFTVPPRISITAPAGGQSWQRGAMHDITWATNTDGNVKIELFRSTVLDSVITPGSANSGLYSWSIPPAQAMATGYRIKVSLLPDCDVTATSGSFSITGAGSYVSVTSPNGGENWQVGNSYYIRWLSDMEDRVRIELWKGGRLNRVVASATPNNGRYSWTVPSNQALGEDYRIRVSCASNGSLRDDSDSDFTVSLRNVTISTLSMAPTTVRPGQPVDLTGLAGTYQAANPAETNRIVIGIRDSSGRWVGGQSVVVFAGMPGDTLPHPWTGADATIAAPTRTGTFYFWALNTAAATDLIAIGDFNSRIATSSTPPNCKWPATLTVTGPAITVTAPDGRESWARDCTYDITWSSYMGGLVRIELYRGLVLNRTITTATANTGAFQWTVPAAQALGEDYRIKVTSTSTSSWNDYSNVYFSIVAVPAGGESLAAAVDAMAAAEPSVGEPDTDGLKKLRAEAVDCSSEFRGSLSNAADGDVRTSWITLGSVLEEREFVTLDLGKVVSITAVGLYPDIDAALFPREFTIELSSDGSGWKPVIYTKDYEAVGTSVWKFERTQTRFVRISGPGVRSATDGRYYWQIAEVKVFRPARDPGFAE